MSVPDISRAPAIASTVQVDAIKKNFQVSDEQITDARELLFKDVSVWDSCSDQQGVKGTAIKTLKFVIYYLTFGGFGGYCFHSIFNRNEARIGLRNPTVFTQKVADFHLLGVSATDAAEGKTQGIDSIRIEKQLQRELESYQEEVLPKIRTFMQTIVSQLPEERQSDMCRALFGAFVIQAIVTQTKSTIDDGSSKKPEIICGLSGNVFHKSLGSKQDWAIKAALRMYYENHHSEIVGKDLASKIGFVAPAGDKIPLERIKELESTIQVIEDQNELVAEASRAVEVLSGGKYKAPTTDGKPLAKDGKNINRDLALVEPRVKAKMEEIQKFYAPAVKAKIDTEVQLAAKRIDSARDISKLKVAFLEPWKANLAFLASGEVKGEHTLINAIRFLNANAQDKTSMAAQVDMEVEELEKRSKLIQEEKETVGKALTDAKVFLEELSESFKKFVQENENLAQKETEYVQSLLRQKVAQPTKNQSSSIEEEHNTLVAKLQEGAEESTNVLGISVRKAIDETGQETQLQTADYIGLLKIVVGKGTSSEPGSPTLTAALLDSLHAKGFLADVFEQLKIANALKEAEKLTDQIKTAEKEVTGAKEEITGAKEEITGAKEEVEDAKTTESDKTQWFRNAPEEVVQARKDAEQHLQGLEQHLQELEQHLQGLEQHLQELEQHSQELEVQLETAKTQVVDSSAYVIDRQLKVSADAAVEAAKFNALQDAGLKKEFTSAADDQKDLNKLRAALGTFQTVTGSTESSSLSSEQPTAESDEESVA